jgi:YVTN family beta-propeller protein
VTPLGGAPGTAGPVREGEAVNVQFRIVAAADGVPVPSLFPAAWLVSADEPGPDVPRPGTPDANLCRRKAESLLNGGPFDTPEIDLNQYYVLTLNDDATISVVDPRFGFGGTKLLNLVQLPAPGSHWVLGGSRGDRLYVSLPDRGAVAVVDTRDWRILEEVPVGPRPGRLVLQPDGRNLWVVTGGPDPGVSVVTTGDPRVVFRIPAGRGDHDVAIDGEGRWAVVTNGDRGTVTVIDAATLRAVATLAVGPRPRSVAYSMHARLAYVTDADGAVFGIDPERRIVANRIPIGGGVGTIRFTPDGQVGFLIDRDRRAVHVLDTSSNRVVHSISTDEGPEQVVFTDNFAYVRHRGSEQVLMIALESVRREGRTPSVVKIAAGRWMPEGSAAPDSIARAPGAAAVIVANPTDKSVYFYKEGLSAPLGTFLNYGRRPTAVLALDRSLRERSHSGIYETVATLRRPGKFDVVFFLDSPRVIHCFPIDVLADPVLQAERDRNRVDVTPLLTRDQMTLGSSIRPLFELIDHKSQKPRTGLKDVRLLMFKVSGGWNERREAEEAVPGIYGAAFRPPEPGTYLVMFECESLGIPWSNPHRLTLQVTGAPAGRDEAPPPSPQPGRERDR